jgi:hypothetical protein
MRAGSGGGILAILNDIDDLLGPAEYEAWYQRDHLPERVSVPGFRHARRYRRVTGEGATYFTFYETEAPEVLRSAAYAARLAAPTPWTRRVMPHFRGMCRTVCRVETDVGAGVGGVVAVAGTAEHPAGGTAPALHGLLERPGITRLRLWRADTDAGLANPEAALRPGGDASLVRILVVEGTMEDAVQAAAVLAAEACGIAAAPVTYRLLSALDAR